MNRRYLRIVVLLGLTAIAYAAALSRGQSLPWIIASLFLAALIVGIAWPRWLVRRISISRSGPDRANEGDTIRLHVRVENHGWLPRFMIEAVDRLPFVGAAAGKSASASTVLGVVAYIGARERHNFEVELNCEKRGFYRLGPTSISTGFPLGLVERHGAPAGGEQSLTIYPELFPILSLSLFGSPDEIHRGDFLLPQGFGAIDFSGLREYRSGDTPRHIHWPTSARANTLMVKEFEPRASAALSLVLDMSSESNVGQGKHASFEYAVRIAASIAQFAHQNNISVSLHGRGTMPVDLLPDCGPIHYGKLLDAFAIVDADGAMPYATVVEQMALQCRRGRTVVLFLSVLPPQIDKMLQAIVFLRSRGAQIVAIELVRESFLERPVPDASEWSGLLDLGIVLLRVRRGDDLGALFNG